MSEWIEVQDDEIDVDLSAREVNISVIDNNFGSVYLTLTYEQIVTIYNKFYSAK